MVFWHPGMYVFPEKSVHSVFFFLFFFFVFFFIKIFYMKSRLTSLNAHTSIIIIHITTYCKAYFCNANHEILEYGNVP